MVVRYEQKKTRRQGLVASFNGMLEKLDDNVLPAIEAWIEGAIDGEGEFAVPEGGAHDPGDIRWIDKLWVDPNRTDLPETGIYVRAKMPRAEGEVDVARPKWVSADIAHLTKAALGVWMRSRGGNNEYAESVVEILLGHHARNDEPAESQEAGNDELDSASLSADPEVENTDVENTDAVPEVPPSVAIGEGAEPLV